DGVTPGPLLRRSCGHRPGCAATPWCGRGPRGGTGSRTHRRHAGAAALRASRQRPGGDLEGRCRDRDRRPRGWRHAGCPAPRRVATALAVRLATQPCSRTGRQGRGRDLFGGRRPRRVGRDVGRLITHRVSTWPAPRGELVPGSPLVVSETVVLAATA